MTRGVRWLGISIVALLTAWVIVPASVPIYDGLANPDEPYRYVDPPPTAKTAKAPTTARRTVAVQNGANVAQFAFSAENGPQIRVYVPAGAVEVPAGVTSLELTATPQAPAPPLPDDGTIVTNVYRFTATAGNRELAVAGTGDGAPTIQMRAPSGEQPGPVFAYRDGTRWVQVQTLRVSYDVYQASVVQFGEWALVQLTDPADGADDGGISLFWLILGIAVFVVASVVFAIRWRRTSAGAH